MDKEDKRRYFVVGSVYLEVVTPLFQQKLEQKYKSLNFGCLKDFLNKTTVLHILFHLRHHAWCCTDKANCTNLRALPLNHHQWKQLYVENPGPGIHNCFCKYTAKSVKPEDLDMSLCGLILYNCCNLGQLNEEAVHILRRNENDYLSSVHNYPGITKDEYDPLMDELTTNILQLDHTKQDELIRIRNRPLDEALCNTYVTDRLDFHGMLNKIDTKIDLILNTMKMNISHINDTLEEISQYSPLKGSITKMDKNVDLRLMTPNNHVTRQDVDLKRMDREDKRRYFIVGSVYLEIVTPLFQQNLEKYYFKSKFRCLQDFLNSKPVIHTLYHIRHHNSICCTDKTNCSNKTHLVITYHQWEQMYANILRHIKHNCFCSYTANSARLEELDVNLCGLILLNCCYLEDLDQKAVNILRRNKNDYLSHNTICGITKDEYDPLMDELKTNILQLDHTKQDELIRIQNRPLDEALCNKYMIALLDIKEKFEKIGASIQGVDETIHRIDTTTNAIGRTLLRNETAVNRIDQTVTETRTTVMEIQATMEELFYYAKRGIRCQCSTDKCQQQVKQVKESIKGYKLGQPIFTLHHKIDLASVVGDRGGYVLDIVMMEDGRLVICVHWQFRLVICNTDGSQVDSIHVPGNPLSVTAVNKFTVAVPLMSNCIEIYDINNKLKLKSISAHAMVGISGITTINNKLVVGGYKILLIIDHQTGEVVQTIKTECHPGRLHGSRDRIFYRDSFSNNKLYWYNYTDDTHHSLTLPSTPISMTTLQDGSLYVGCKDKSLQQVSSDGKQYKPVKTFQFTSDWHDNIIHYNLIQRKLVIVDNKLMKVLNEL